MSILDIHGDLLSSLESALDVGKIFSVFNKLIGIIKDQQDKINQSESRIIDLYSKFSKAEDRRQVSEGQTEGGRGRSRSSSESSQEGSTTGENKKSSKSRRRIPYYDAKISKIEAKLNEVMLNVNGNGEENLALPEDVSPYLAFQKAGASMSVEVMEPTPEKAPPVLVPEPIPELVLDESEHEAFALAVSTQLVNEELEGKFALVAAMAMTEVREHDKLQELAEEERIAAELHAKQAAEAAAIAAAHRAEVLAAKEAAEAAEAEAAEAAAAVNATEASATEAATEDPSDQDVVDHEVAAITKSAHVSRAATPKTATPAVVASPARSAIPSPIVPQQTSLTPVTQVVQMVDGSTSPIPFISRLGTPAAPPTAWVSDPFPPPTVVHVEPEPGPEEPPVVVTPGPVYEVKMRRRMDANNLTLLSAKKRARVVRALYKRGQFLHIAQEFNDDATKKYANHSLKQRVDVLEAEIKRVHSRAEHLRNAVKRDHLAIKELLPMEFNECYTSLVEVLNTVNANGGAAALHDLMRNAVCFDHSGNLSRRFLNKIVTHMRATTLFEYELRAHNELAQLKGRLLDLSAQVITRDDIQSMLMPTATQKSAFNSGGGDNADGSAAPDVVDVSDQNTDPMHSKLVNLINMAIQRHQAGIDLANSNKKYTALSMSSGVTKEQMEEARLAAARYTDERMVVMRNAIKQVAYSSDAKTHQFSVEFAAMQEQLQNMQELYQSSLTTQGESLELFRKESEALKVLQRKVANMAIDKLMADLASVHRELRTRPSASEVGEMMDLVEHTMKSHLGENIVGLKGLVEQVYRHIQHKVDRDDIKGLITVKLSQMEADLLRREEEVYSMTSTTRCLSCGQWPAGGGGPGSKLTSVAGGGHHHSNHNHSSHSHASTGGSTYPTADSEDQTIGTTLMSLSTPNLTGPTTGSVSPDQIHTLVAGSGGLRPLLPQHSPMKPVRDPYNNANTNAVSRRRAGNAEKIPEPLYRKAKMAAQMKEMVKVSAPSSAMYGYGPSNPLYVLDGMVAGAAADGGSYDDSDAGSVLSESGRSSVAPYTRGSTAATRNSTANSTGAGTRGAVRFGSNNSSGVGGGNGGLHLNTLPGGPVSAAVSASASGPQSRRSSGANTNTGDYVVLPSIVTSPNMPPAGPGSFFSVGSTGEDHQS